MTKDEIIKIQESNFESAVFYAKSNPKKIYLKDCFVSTNGQVLIEKPLLNGVIQKWRYYSLNKIYTSNGEAKEAYNRGKLENGI